MAYDESLAARVRKVLARRKNVTEMRLFGGFGFMLNGNMCVGVWKEFLILRLGLDQYEGAMREPCVKEFDITGRPMRGWVMVEPGGVESDEELQQWVQCATTFTGTLPPK